MRDPEDAELVGRCREGDLAAFEVVYRRYKTSLYNVVLRMVGRAPEAEDLLQEIFLLAFQKLDGFRAEAALSTWLYRIAVNRCLDHLRSRAHRNRSVTDALESEPVSNPEVLPGAPRSSFSSSLQARLDLEKAVALLPESCRAAFLLYDVEGLGHREVAEVLGVAEGTSKSLVHNARLKLRAFLAPAPPGEPS